MIEDEKSDKDLDSNNTTIDKLIIVKGEQNSHVKRENRYSKDNRWNQLVAEFPTIDESSTPTHKKYIGEFLIRAYFDDYFGQILKISHPDTDKVIELEPTPSWLPGETKYVVVFDTDGTTQTSYKEELLWPQALQLAFNYVKPQTVSKETIDLLVTADILGEDSLDDKGWTKL